MWRHGLGSDGKTQGHGRAVQDVCCSSGCRHKGTELPRRTKKKVTEVKADLAASLSQVRSGKAMEQKEHYRGWIKKSQFVQG